MSTTDPMATGQNPTSTGTGGTSADTTSAGGTGGRENMKGHLNEAGGHLKQAARDGSEALPGAASAAGEHLRSRPEQVRNDLSSGARASRAAADELGGAAREQYDDIMDKGRELCDSAAELIRERPLVAFGSAFAAGWIIAKLARGGR